MKCLSQVMARTDKITRCRVLIGFLGMEPQIQTDRIIYEMLTDCQQPKLHEEWVRCTAGLVQGILFQKDPEENNRQVASYHAAGPKVGPSWKMSYWNHQQDGNWTSICRVGACRPNPWAPPCCSG